MNAFRDCYRLCTVFESSVAIFQLSKHCVCAEVFFSSAHSHGFERSKTAELESKSSQQKCFGRLAELRLILWNHFLYISQSRRLDFFHSGTSTKPSALITKVTPERFSRLRERPPDRFSARHQTTTEPI